MPAWANNLRQMATSNNTPAKVYSWPANVAWGKAGIAQQLSANSSDITTVPATQSKQQAASVGDSGEPPHNDGMEARISALENAVKELPTKATFAELRAEFANFKTDVAKSQGELRTEMAKGFGDIRADLQKGTVDVQRWMIATVIGLFLGFGGLFLAMSNALKPVPQPPKQQAVAPTQQPPIIINVPTPAAPPVQSRKQP